MSEVIDRIEKKIKLLFEDDLYYMKDEVIEKMTTKMRAQKRDLIKRLTKINGEIDKKARGIKKAERSVEKATQEVERLKLLRDRIKRDNEGILSLKIVTNDLERANLDLLRFTESLGLRRATIEHVFEQIDEIEKEIESLDERIEAIN